MDHIRLAPIREIRGNHANPELEIRYMPRRPFGWGKRGEDLEGLGVPGRIRAGENRSVSFSASLCRLAG